MLSSFLLLASQLLGCSAELPSELARPNALALGADGTLYVSDFGHDRIVAFDPEGDVQRTFGSQGLGTGQLWRVYDVAIDTDGSVLVANRRPEDASSLDGDVWEVKRFRDGREVDALRFDGHFASASHSMNSLATADGGLLVVANPGGGELFQMNREGTVVGSFGGVLHPQASPHAITRDGDDYWVVDQAQHGMYRVTAAGAVPFFLDDDGHGPLRFPSAVAVCPGEWLAVADLGNHRVQRFDIHGDYLSGFTPERAGPDQPVQLMDIATDATCERLYLADSKGDRVLVTDLDGTVLLQLHDW